MKTLVLFAHPRTDRSEVNRPLLEAARSVDGVTVVDLYAEYPTFDIDVDREQERLLAHDAIVLQHPLYWYSSPAILKEWQDLVLEHGWAYGHEGHALDGKVALNAVTCGGAREVYTARGANEIELRALLAPFEKTFHLCRMRYLAPFAVFGAGVAGEEGRIEMHVREYAALLAALVGDRVHLDRAESILALTDDLAHVLADREAI